MRVVIDSPVYGQINAKWAIPNSAVITADMVSDKK